MRIGMNEYVVEVPCRADVFVSERAGLTRSAVKKLADGGHLFADGVPVKAGQLLKAGAKVTVEIPAPVPIRAQPEDIPVDIVYEDEDIAVVNKPQGMTVHAGAGRTEGTLVNALLYRLHSLSGINGEIRPGIVHRIDKDTSGLLVVAKNDAAHQGLSAQMAVHSIHRVYHAVVYGNLKEDAGTVEAPIGRDARDRKKMAVTQQNAKYACTHWQVLERFGRFTYIACKLETGRTHQIRVHMAHIGHPLAGDPVYGPRRVIAGLHGQCLYAKELGFIHPVTGEALRFDSPLPAWFTAFLERLRKERRE